MVLARILLSIDGIKAATKAVEKENAEFWLARGDAELESALSLTPNTNLARNIIIMIGDGMSLPTVTAARVYKAQQQKREFTSTKLAWETLDYAGFSKVGEQVCSL